MPKLAFLSSRPSKSKKRRRKHHIHDEPEPIIKREEFTLTTCPRCNLEVDGEEAMLDHLMGHRPAFRRQSDDDDRLACPEDGCQYLHALHEAMEAHVRWRHRKLYCLYCDEFVASDTFK